MVERMTSKKKKNNLSEIPEIPNDSHTKGSIPKPIIPDGGWGWAVVFSSFMIHFIMDG